MNRGEFRKKDLTKISIRESDRFNAVVRKRE
jgi:hypothetical protein